MSSQSSENALALERDQTTTRQNSSGRRLADATAWVGGMALLEPLVGVVWQRALGHALGVPVAHAYSLLLGLSLWLVYIADRWLDATVLRGDVTPSARHGFARRHRVVLGWAWGVALVLDLVLAIVTLDAVGWFTRVALLGATLAYFGAVHWRGGKVPKELLVTLIYSAGVSVFAWPALGAPWAWSPTTCLALSGFALLVLLNLATIAEREREQDQAQGFHSLAQHPWLPRVVSVTALILAAAALGGIFVGGAFQRWFGALFASTLLLLLLGRAGRSLHEDHFHLAADAALLTPLIVAWP